MKTEISDIKRTVETASINESTATRTWSMGQRTSRTDVAMVGVLCVDSVDAVFEEEAFSFMESAVQLHDSISSQSEPVAIVESLASQLAVLESQCVNLRRMLEMAATSE